MLRGALPPFPPSFATALRSVEGSLTGIWVQGQEYWKLLSWLFVHVLLEGRNLFILTGLPPPGNKVQ